jgi:hypothetical protein
MARLLPSDISHLALAGAGEPELETLRQLQAKLPSSYTVFHGVHWSREYKSDIKFGELDFVIVNQGGKALVIEQKNGPLEETANGPIKAHPERAKSVGDQVRRSLDGVREKFKWVHRDQADLDLDYLIYCPDYRVANLNAASIEASRIVDAPVRHQLAEAVESVLGPGTPGPAAERVQQFFRQTFDLVPDVHAHVSSQERNFTRLSSELINLLGGLEMHPFRLRVDGTAGAGKTLIARQFFDDAVARGRRPLLVCYNRPLAEKLKAVVGAGGMVGTFRGLCSRFLAERGHRFDFREMNRDPAFWPRVVELVAGEAIPAEWTFDTLIVDEGQDFEQEWLDILKLFLREGHEALWLEDRDQNLRGRPPVALDGFVGYRARRNYRSPDSIARFIRRTLPFTFECANDLPGLGVGVTTYLRPAEQLGLVGKIIHRLLDQGFTHDDIAILSLHGAANSVFSTCEKVGGYPLRRFIGDYDLSGNQVLTPGKIAFESVGRFKGQQAPAVILVDIDPAPERLEHCERLAFAGMTRATVRLETLARASNPLNERFLAWGVTG